MNEERRKELLAPRWEYVRHSLARCIAVEAIDERRYDAIQLVAIEKRRYGKRLTLPCPCNSALKLSFRDLGPDATVQKTCDRTLIELPLIESFEVLWPELAVIPCIL
jgi:hypothetical protein